MSPIKRGGVYYLYIPKQKGGRPVLRSTGTTSPHLYRLMKLMVKRLKGERRWSLLNAVIGNRLTLGAVFDADRTKTLDALESSLSASALRPLVKPYLDDALARGLSARNVEDNLTRQLDSFLAFVGEDATTADLTPAKVTAWLSSLTTKPVTRRQYLYAVTGFTRYLWRTEVIPTFPLDRVEAPEKGGTRMRYEPIETDRKIVDAAKPEYRAIFAYIKATGVDVSMALATTRRQLNLAEHTADIYRSKTTAETMPVAIIEAWAIPYLAAHCADKLAGSKLWPDLTRSQLAHHHTACCEAVGVDDYTLRDSRHSVAVRMIAEGYDVFEVADQLNNDAALVAHVYARHVTNAKKKAAEKRAEGKNEGKTTPNVTSSVTRTAGSDRR